MPSDIVVKCSHTLKDKNFTIAFAESITAGKMVSEFALIPYCGSVLKGAIACYDRSVKETLMGVNPEIIDQFTAESAEVTEQLSIGLKKLIPADVIVAITGLASEGGSETPEKPVGTMFINGFIKDRSFSKVYKLDGNPPQIILQAVDKAAELVLEKLAEFGI